MTKDRRRPSLRLPALAGLLAAAALSACAAAGADEGSLQAAFDARGLAGLHGAGQDLLADGAPRLEQVVFERWVSEGDPPSRKRAFTKLDAPQPDSAAFDAEARRLVQKYAWGEVELAYTPRPGRLDVALTLRNRSEEALANFRVAAMRLRYQVRPAAPAEDGKKRSPPARVQSLDDVAVLRAELAGGTLLACVETIDPPVWFALAPVRGADGEYDVTVSGGVQAPEDGAYEVPPHGRPRVEPGRDLTLEFSLRIARPGADVDALLADLYGRFRDYWKPVAPWTDRRGVGMLMLCNSAKRSQTNPRGFWNDPKVDVTTEQGKADFRRRAMDYADRAVKVLTDVDAQGMIVWDVEGSENPHPITYIGDPRMAKTLAPEMDEVADEFFQKFRDAGLRTGVCIRPSQVYYDENKKQWSHGTGSDGLPGRGDHYGKLRGDVPAWRFFPVVERLSDKIAYAKKRWGCTIFYIDTNGIYRPTGEDNRFEWQLLPASMWRRLKTLHPDVLLVPELCAGDGTYHAAAWAYTATYFELDLGGVSTPRRVLRLLPDAFSVLNVSDGPFDERRAELLAAVRRGDILMFHGWWAPKVNEKVKQLYAEARATPSPQTAPAQPGAGGGQ